MRPSKQLKTRAKRWDFTIQFAQKSRPDCLQEILRHWGQPQTPAHTPTRKIDYELPPRRHLELLDRAPHIQQIHQWLQAASPQPIAIEGMGGIGKTALALEIAHQYLQQRHLPLHHPTFDAIIFVSVQSQQTSGHPSAPHSPTSYSLRDILRSINYILTERHELPTDPASQIQHLYRVIGQRQPLIVVDNIENPSEQTALLDFLGGIPESAKVLITSRESLGLPQTIYLQPIATKIAAPYIKKQLKQRGINIQAAEIAPIVAAIAGSPFAMEHVLREITTHYHSPKPFQLPQNLQHSIAFINEFCFSSSLRSLQTNHNAPALTTLFTLSFFFYPVSETVLTQITQLSPLALHQSLEDLRELHLIEKNNAAPELKHHSTKIVPTLHSLIRSYVTNQLAQQPELAQQLRQQWLAHYQSFAATGGTGGTPPGQTPYWLEWHDYSPLIADWQNLRTAVDWCLAENRYADVIHFCQSLNGFTILTGQWLERQHWNDYLLAESQLRQDRQLQAEAIFQASLTLTYINEADPDSAALELALEAWQQRQHCSIDWQFNVAILLAILYLRKSTYTNHDRSQAATAYMQRAKEIAATLPPNHPSATYYQCQIYHYEAELDYVRSQFDTALAKYQQALHLAQSIAYQRCIAYCTGRSAKILFEQQQFSQAQESLMIALAKSEEYHDYRSTAFCYFYLAQIAQQQQAPDQALQYAQQAQKIFIALGMYQEADKLRAMTDAIGS